MKHFILVVLLVAAMVVCGTVAAFARSPQTYTYVLMPTDSEFSNPNAGGALTVTVGSSGTEWWDDGYGTRKKLKYWWVTWDFDVWGLTPNTGYMANEGLAFATDASGSFSATFSRKVYVQNPPDGSGFTIQYFIPPYPGAGGGWMGGWWVAVLVAAH